MDPCYTANWMSTITYRSIVRGMWSCEVNRCIKRFSTLYTNIEWTRSVSWYAVHRLTCSVRNEFNGISGDDVSDVSIGVNTLAIFDHRRVIIISKYSYTYKLIIMNQHITVKVDLTLLRFDEQTSGWSCVEVLADSPNDTVATNPHTIEFISNSILSYLSTDATDISMLGKNIL